MKFRRTYKCIQCGVLLSGRELADGRIVSYDRAPNDPKQTDPDPCMCEQCRGRKKP